MMSGSQIKTEHSGEAEAFFRRGEASQEIREILAKRGLSVADPKIKQLCRDCLRLHSSVMAKKIFQRLGMALGEAEKLCRLCREINAIRNEYLPD